MTKSSSTKQKFPLVILISTGILSQLRAKLRDRAVRPVRAGCYFRAALSLTDSKTRYVKYCVANWDVPQENEGN